MINKPITSIARNFKYKKIMELGKIKEGLEKQRNNN